MKVATGVAAVVLAVTLVPHSGSTTPPTTTRVKGSYDATAAAAVPAAVRPRVVVAPLLRAAPGGDGDSWHDTAGREYRLGLVNTPEYDECYGSTATAKRKALTAGGFRARVYARDTYGRRVAVVTTAAGLNVNVYLARHGYANDRYLAQFRAENPALARQLDAAFAAAKAERAGLWGACGRRAPAAPVAAPVPLVGGSGGNGCHPAYATCIPVKGDGSGSGAANDLDCGDIRKPVRLKQIGVDPYRLDANGDGTGCDSYG